MGFITRQHLVLGMSVSDLIESVENLSGARIKLPPLDFKDLFISVNDIGSALGIFH